VIVFEHVIRARRLFAAIGLALAWASIAAAQPQPPTPPAPPAPATQTPAQPAQPPATPPPAQPSTQAPSSAPGSLDTVQSDRQEVTNSQKTQHHIGRVELTLKDAAHTTIYADDVWLYTDENRFVATGNVLFAQGNNRITAERAEFNTQSGTGTFYTAWGVAPVQPPRQSNRPGAFAPPVSAGETSVYFFGETIEKVGPKKYKITKGGFSTCVQPTPRWDLTAGTVILNVDHYTVLRDAILNVKGVPILYYPTKREGRATGFLIPTYGVSSLRGQSIHDAFFWAINRSQDATVMHDWFSKTGQGAGAEYRYNYGNGTDGNFRTYLLDQHSTTYTQSDGSSTSLAGSRSYEIRGGANQLLPGRLRARANIDYFSSIATSQTFNTNIYDISRNLRSFGGNVIGAWSTYSLNATLDHREYFWNLTDSNLSGSWPRVTLTRNERPIIGSSVYFSLSSEYAHFLRDTRTATGDLDSSLTRLDLSPQVRFPFKKWQWFTVNSTVNWRDTYYTRSQVPNTQTLVDEGLNRRLYTLQTQIVGPVFNKIWDTPESGYAEKYKHTIEPSLNIQRTSSVDNIPQIVQYDGIDSFIGGVRYTYALTNRFYAKVRPATPGGTAQAREIIDIDISQSYNTNQDAALYDRQYQTINGQQAPTHFSPIALGARVVPTNDMNATVRAEIDGRYRELRQISAQGTYTWTNRVQMTAGWSKKAFISELLGFNDPRNLDHYVNAMANVHTKDNRIGTIYSFNYDVLRSTLVQQRISSFYNAQCCGLALEYQSYHFPFSTSPIPADHRFFLSFTLAGLGNFSPFNGALGGVPR
jgi:LPS-assembly protein